ncbi:MAG TPA: hypothetical protein VMX76_02945 [Nevskiaceae bacterium]|nr:hypothetical protein [Nevskiaceae bacterium]
MNRKIISKTLNQVYVLLPGGNITTLVEDKISRPLQPALAKKIMKLKPEVEQVGFIEKPKNGKAAARLQMMGGEFCGNSTRCLGWLLLEGKPGKVKLEVSGAEKLLEVEINKKGNVKTEMPIKSTLSSVQKIKDKYWIVFLKGITQVIIEECLIPKRVNRRKLASKILDILDLKQLEAAGVLFIKNQNPKIFMDPFIWVRDVKTFFNETACASGAAAVGLWQAKKRKSSVNNLEVIQPSKNSIFVTVKKNKSKFLNAWIKGPVKLLYKGSLSLA